MRIDVQPLQARSYSPDEIDFVRDQAEFYYLILEQDPFYTLLPACAFCASDKLYENRVNCELICEECGKPNDSIKLKAGRLAIL